MPAPGLATAEVLTAWRIMALDRLPVMSLFAFRLKDRVHHLDVSDVRLIDAAMRDRLPEPPRPRLAELIAHPDGWKRGSPVPGKIPRVTSGIRT